MSPFDLSEQDFKQTSHLSPARQVSKLESQFRACRRYSEAICAPLLIEDYLLQAMPETSPAKWHIAHTSWFFETFILKPFLTSYKPFNPHFEILFNSYYNGVGKQYPRTQRGLLSRPSVDEVIQYRHYVDDNIQHLLANLPKDHIETILQRLELGCHHEQQHQELFFTDLKYCWFQNPLYPVYSQALKESTPNASPLSWIQLKGGLVDIGHHDSTSFCFDNEQPSHKQYIEPFLISSRLVTNREYLEFVQDRAYQRSDLWLSDAWSEINKQGWRAPLYWIQQDGEWFEYTLHGLLPLDLDRPICHISAYEADAYARWSNCRLPTEFEWEYAAKNIESGSSLAQFSEPHAFHPRAQDNKISPLLGSAWQWTSSAYSPYPGYKPADGAIGEYNGKFMCNQLVLRGGSCVSNRSHVRHSYRNFFYPADRWQFTSLRLVK